MTDIEKACRKDIDAAQKKLIQKAQKQGLYEYFGQNEGRKLEDKYGRYSYDWEHPQVAQMLGAFREWAMTYTG